LANLKDSLIQAKKQFDEDPLRIAYARLFTTPDGKEVLKDLRKQFYDVVIVGNGASETSIIAKSAQHDVITVILKMIGDET